MKATVSADVMADARARSTEVVHLFVAGVYAFPLIGGVISDRLLGKYRTILWVSLIYCAGHAVLAVAGRIGAMQQYRRRRDVDVSGPGTDRGRLGRDQALRFGQRRRSVHRAELAPGDQGVSDRSIS